MEQTGRRRGALAVVAVAGVVAAIAGLVLGLLPVAATGGGSCGSPFAPAAAGSGMSGALVDIWCSDDLASRRLWAVLLIGTGVAAVGVAVWLWFARGGDSGAGAQDPREAGVGGQQS